jgi:P27 family predicted phage terminase small subunit
MIKRAPSTLSKEAQRIWKLILTSYELDDEAGMLLLKSTLEAYDRAQAAKDVIDREGMQIIDRFQQVKPHPLLTTERDARSQFMAGMKQLNFDLEPLRDGPGRPPLRP